MSRRGGNSSLTLNSRLFPMMTSDLDKSQAKYKGTLETGNYLLGGKPFVVQANPARGVF